MYIGWGAEGSIIDCGLFRFRDLLCVDIDPKLLLGAVSRLWYSVLCCVAFTGRGDSILDPPKDLPRTPKVSNLVNFYLDLADCHLIMPNILFV